MPKGKAISGKGTSKASPGTTKEGLSALCVGECGRTVTLSVADGVPIREMVFTEKGWSALNTPESRTVSFICPDCFRTMEESEEETPLDGLDPNEDADGP